MKRLYYILMLLSVSGMSLMAQVKGTVVDSANEPIEGVAVVMQTMDSVFVDAAITDSLGLFHINRSLDTTHRLLFQHLLFEATEQEISLEEVGTVTLASRDYELGEIVVKGERPVVKVENGALAYDVQQLIKDKTATSAFEAVKELPGISGTDESIELVGARSLHIVLNGQLTTLTMPQLIQLLKSMPASRIQKAEIMYNAPARYNVKGSLINIVLDQPSTEGETFQGESAAFYDQRHYASGGVRTNLMYAQKGLSIDFLVNGDMGRNFGGEEIVARHTLDDEVILVEQNGRRYGKKRKGSARLGLDYQFATGDKLSGTYYAEGDRSVTNRISHTQYTPLAEKLVSWNQTDAKSKGTDFLQNARIQFDGHKGLMAGIDYTYYRSPSTLYYYDQSNTGEEINMLNEGKQTASRYSAFINQTHNLGAWRLNYGMQGGFSSSKNRIEYFYDKGNGYILDLESLEDNKQKDYTANAFVDVSRNFGEKLTANVAMKVEYFKSDYTDNDGLRSNLWSEWALFPTVSLNYTISPYHILQLNVNSDKTYPTYWTLSPQRYPLNSYSDIIGNPTLKPYRSYSTQLVYIFRQKYMLMAFNEYEPDYFAQVPYQSDNELKNIFRYENFDYALKTGLAVIVPFQVGSVWNSRVTVNGFRMQEKSDHFHSMSFNREAYVGAFIMNNTFNLSKRPNVKMTLDGQYVTPGSIQGVYDLGYMYIISAGLKWTFADEKASLTLQANDIFSSGMPHTIRVRQGNQWTDMNNLTDSRSVRLTFSYRFGGYKEKKHQQVDRSRFGH